MGTKKKKKKTVKKASEITDDSTPRSFVFHRGDVGKILMQLITDMRHVMEPYTATNLKVLKSNVLKDFVHVAGPYGISHFIMFSKTELSPYMRICRLPRGPTLTFKLHQYSLMKDVVAIIRKPKTIGEQFRYPPLVVLNNFNGDLLQMKLMTSVFQNMFPSIKVQKVKLAEIRRCVMFNYNAEEDTIDFRHYNIEAVPVGISRGVKKLLKNKVPNLGSLNEIDDFVTGAAYLSESEGEEAVESHVTLPQRLPGKGNVKSAQSAVKLTEMGPRLTFELFKIEEGLNDGEVLYHKFVTKSEKEIKAMKRNKEKARKLKEQRRREQEANITRKEQEKEANKARSLAGMKRKLEKTQGDKSDSDNEGGESGEASGQSDMDDNEYFRQEVGENPDEELQSAKPKRREQQGKAHVHRKKRKLGKEDKMNENETAHKKKSKLKNKKIKSTVSKFKKKSKFKPSRVKKKI